MTTLALAGKAFISVLVVIVLKVWNTETVSNFLGPYVKRLPKALQWIPPLVLAMIGTAVADYNAGMRGAELWQAVAASGGEIGVLAIGIYHVLKRVIPGADSKPVLPPAEPPKA